MNTVGLPSTVIIGGANLDVTGSCENRVIPGDSNPGTIRTSAGGVGRNIAENLARLNFRCTMLTALGDDVGKELIIRSCKDTGIDISHVMVEPQLATGSYIAINNQLGALLAAVSDMEIIHAISPDWLEQKHDIILSHDQILIEANLDEASLQWIAANRQDKPLLVDAVSATKAVKLKSILSEIELLKVNRDEAAAILGQQAKDDILAQMLFEEKGVKNVLLSQGPQGAMLYTQNGLVRKSAIKGINASDTGAGDALFAGYVAARHLLNTEAEQLEFAIACATFTLSSLLSVNPLLSVNEIHKQYLNHLSRGAWRT
ncbi:MAG: carbohydrate kinase family protein [Reinekea sp.]|jgi:pseudouridine kinase